MSPDLLGVYGEITRVEVADAVEVGERVAGCFTFEWLYGFWGWWT